jgi:hypothetical protein
VASFFRQFALSDQHEQGEFLCSGVGTTLHERVVIYILSGLPVREACLLYRTTSDIACRIPPIQIMATPAMNPIRLRVCLIQV